MIEKELLGLKGFSAWSVYNKLCFNILFCRAYNFKRPKLSEIIEKALNCDDIDEIKQLIPEIAHQSDRVFFTHEEVIRDFKKCSDKDRELLFLEALTFCDLSDEDAIRLLSLHKDINNIQYNKENIINIKTVDLVPMLIESLIFCSHQHIDLGIVTDQEISALNNERVSVSKEASEILSANSEISVKDLIALALKKAFSGR